MSDAINSLISQQQKGNKKDVDVVYNNIHSGFKSGMSAQEIMSNFNFPEGAEPYRMVNSAAMANRYNISLEKAHEAYYHLKESLYPNVADADLTKSLYLAEKELPESTVTQETHEQKAKKDMEKYPAYAKERKKAEADMFEDNPQGWLQSRQSYEKQSKPILKERVRNNMADDWFGKGTERDNLKERFHDALYNAESDVERKEATKEYVNNLQKEQEEREKQWDRIEYQIENHTEEESFWERKKLAGKRAAARTEGMLAYMGERIAKTVGKIPGLDEKEFTRYGKGDPYIPAMDKIQREARDEMLSPELWRQDLNWLDHASNVIIEQSPTIGLTALAASAGGASGGPMGAKAAIFFTMGAAEGYEIKASALERGYSLEEANRRGNIGAALNGMIEAVGGGAAKYFPKSKLTKRIAIASGRMGKNVLKEILMEEVPQETIQAILSDNVPYHPDGTLNYDEIANQIIMVAQDAAILSVFMGSTQKGIESISAHKARVQSGLTKKDFNQFQDDLHEMVESGQSKEAKQKELLEKGESFEGEGKYSEDMYDATALKEQLPLGKEAGSDMEAMKKDPFYLMPNAKADKVEFPWHIKDFTDLAHDRVYKTYDEAFTEYKKLARPEVWHENVQQKLEKLPPEISEPLKAKRQDYTEDLINIEYGTRYYAVQKGPNDFTIMDADTNTTVSEGLTSTQMVNAKKELEVDTKTDDPITRIYRFTKSRVDNGAFTDVYGPISDMLSPNNTHKQRMDSAEKLKEYVTNLRNGLALEVNKKTADKAIPKNIEEQLDVIAAMWDRGRMVHTKDGKSKVGFISKDDKENVSKAIRNVMRLSQKYGTGSEADMFRNWVRSYIGKVKEDKHFKKSPGKAKQKPNILSKIKEGTIGASKDDFITTLTKLMGTDEIPLSMEIIGARMKALNIFGDLYSFFPAVKEELGITNKDLQKWSQVQSHKLGHKTDLFDVQIAGESQKLSMVQVIYLNLAMRDSKLKEVISNEGVSDIGDGVIELGAITKEEQSAIVDLLYGDAKAAALYERMLDFYIDKRGAYENDAHMEMDGYTTVTEESFLPDTRRNSSDPLLIHDATAQLVEDISSTARYAGIQPTLDRISILTGSKALKRKINDVGKIDQLERFQTQMEAMAKASPMPQMNIEKLVTKIGANRARSILSNVRIAALQAGSFQLYQNETSSRYMRPSYVPKELYDSFQLYMSRKMQIGSVHSVVSKSTARKTWQGKDSNLDYIMYPMHAVDLAVVKQSLRIAFNEMNDKTLTGKARRYWSKMGNKPPKIGEPGFQDALHERAAYLMYTTQPMFFPESRNAYSTSDNVFVREISRFRSFTDQLLRNNARQMALWDQGEISSREAFGNIARNVWFATVWYNGLKWALTSIWKEAIGDEDDDYNLLLEMLLGPISWIPFVGWTLKTGITSLISDKGYGPANFSTLTFDQVTHTADTIYTLSKAIKAGAEGDSEKSKKLWKKGMKKAASDTLVYMGLPDYPLDLIPDDDTSDSGGGFTLF